MLQYLINVTDNTFISAIMLALLCAALIKFYPQTRHRIIISGIAFGFVIAFVYAILKRNTGFAVREYYDLALASLWVLSSIPLLVMLLMKNGFSTKRCNLLINGLFTLTIGLVAAQCLPNLMLFPFEFDVGMDSIFNNDYLLKWVGYLFSLVLTSVIGLTIYRICCQLSDRSVRLVVSVAVVLFTLQNCINIMQILIVRRLTPYADWMMDLVMFILSNINVFIFIFIAISLFLAIGLYLKALSTSEQASNPAKVRKIRAQLLSDRRKSILIMAGVTVTAYTITRARYILEQGIVLSPAEPVLANGDGLITIPLDKVNDGNLHRYGYQTADGIIVRFIIIKKSENAYGVGLDACDICGTTGYYQRGDQVVCIMCDVVMNIATIGFPGGCNPVPLKYEIASGNMVIDTVNLEAEKTRFQE